MVQTLKNDDVVFVFPSSDPSVYEKYGATLVASSGTHAPDHFGKLGRLGVRASGTVSCLTAGSHDIHAHTDLAEACARDIEGAPIAVPWLHTASFQGAPAYFGCINHPAFRAHVRRKVCDAVSGGASGLHVDEHLSSAYAALHCGGCFCDRCISGFSTYLSQRSTPGLCSEAKVSSFEGFDYKSFVKNMAPTRSQYLALNAGIPLRREFIDYQLACAASNVASW